MELQEFSEKAKIGAYIEVYWDGATWRGEYRGFIECIESGCWLHQRNTAACLGLLSLQVSTIDGEPSGGINNMCLCYEDEPNSEEDYEKEIYLDIDAAIIYPEGLGINKIVVT